MVTIKQAAQAVDCSELTIRRRINEGKLIARRIGPRAIRIERESLLQFLAGEPLGVDAAMRPCGGSAA
jgi:excisionase family DNA binding protein